MTAGRNAEALAAAEEAIDYTTSTALGERRSTRA